MGGVDDGREKFVVGQAREPGHDWEVRAHRMEPGQRVDLEERKPARGVAAQIDPCGIAARQGPLPGRPSLFFFHAVTRRPDATVHLWAGDLPVLYARRVDRGVSIVFTGTVLGEGHHPEATPFWKADGWSAVFGRAILTALGR